MTDWSQAKCIGKSELFFDERPNSLKKARLLCLGCPIKADCLQHALEYKEAWGIWAGLDYRELGILAASLGYDPPTRREIEHGTEAGWAWHRRQKEKYPAHVPCQPCVDAYNLRAKVRMARYRKKKAGK